ncbi:MAG TPA: helix-turn-helix transcriptional regulator [Ktedonobacterales bacterium]|jgi:transcriptional regulator with XRE-family HTH domain
MSRFHQRLQEDMKDSEFAAGFREMDAALNLLHAIEEARRSLHITQKELATRMGRRREAVTRILTGDEANPTLETITELLSALGLKAEITLRPAEPDDTPITATFVSST